jgi:hypothetical protein
LHLNISCAATSAQSGNTIAAKNNFTPGFIGFPIGSRYSMGSRYSTPAPDARIARARRSGSSRMKTAKRSCISVACARQFRFVGRASRPPLFPDVSSPVSA